MIAVGIGLLAAAALVGWCAAGRHARGVALASWVLGAVGSVALVVAGGLALGGHAQTVSVDDPLGTLGLSADPVAGLFLVVTFGVAVPAMVAGCATGPRRPRLGATVALALAAAAVVLCASDLFVLLAGWEVLGFAFYLTIGYDRRAPGRSTAAMLAVAFSKASGAALLLGGLTLAATSHTIELDGLAAGAGPARRGAAFALLVLAFTTKVGLVPLHLWLPRGYSAAPGPARPLLAGAAVNVGFYGLWRTLDVLGPPPTWLACVVLVVAGLGAILGITHAAVHADLAHLVAWSSVENAGLIVVGYGVALLGALTASTRLLAAGLVAATAQVIAHALGKSVLFLGVGEAEDAAGTTDLDRLRGVARTRPAAGVALLVGSLTLAGLPLTAGFASEWLTLEALMQQFRLGHLTLQLCAAAAAVLVALTIGLAGLTFVRVVGLTVFGSPPVPARPGAGRGAAGRAALATGVGLLVAGCLGAAAFAPLELRLVAAGLRPLVGGTARDSVTGRWILQPVFADFSALSPSWLWIVLPGYVLLALGLTLAVSGRRLLRVRRVPAWQSASNGVPGAPGYTSFGFANPVRKVLAGMLMTRHELLEHAPEAPGRATETTERAAPAAQRARLGYTVDVVDVVERYGYRPAVRAFRAVVHAAKRLQSGRLDAYLAYMLVALVALIALVTALAG